VYVADLSRGVVNLAARNVSDPSWSPDGGLIACWRPAAEWRLHVYDIAACGDLSQPCLGSVPEIGQALEPRWSPDGSHIAFLTASPLGSLQLAAFDTACLTGQAPCSQSLTLLSSPLDEIDDFVWSPDGQALAYTVRGGQGVDVYIVRLDGTGAILAASVEGRFIPQLDWGIAPDH
jgi:dipeptidyl aminopeptidase/acylaminoacyl peptidase